MKTIPAKTILSGYAPTNPWFGTNYNMNIYKGCSHRCIYCDSRSACYNIADFDTVRAKEDVLAKLTLELRRKKKKGVIGMGAMSDPYNPQEKKHTLTRGALELIAREQFGVSIATKSDLVARDIDHLQAVKAHAPTLVKLTITTLDDTLCQKIEPHVVPTSKRLEAICKLSEAGIYTGVLLMPILPFINDTEENIVGIVKASKQAGAKFIYAYGFGVTLRDNQRTYFFDQLNQLDRGQDLVKRYIRQYGNSYACSSVQHKELWNVFKETCEQYQIEYRMPSIITGYQQGYAQQQLTLF